MPSAHAILYRNQLFKIASVAQVALLLLLTACGQQTADERRAAVASAAAVAPTISAIHSEVNAPLHSLRFAEETIPASLPGGACNFDLIAGKGRDTPDIEVERSGDTQYTGWAAVAVNEGALAEHVKLALVGTKTYTALPVVDVREDVAAYFKVFAMKNAGFAAKASAADVIPGKYQLKVYMQSGDKFFECGTAKNVTVK